jgi:hypothetical protein
VRRILLALGLLCSVATGASAWWQSVAQQSVGASTTTWNNSNKGPNVTLSGGNLIATITSGTDGVTAVSGRSTGKCYFSLVTTGTNNLVWAGIANAAFPVSGSSAGSTSNGAAIAYTTGTVFFNSGGIGGAGGGAGGAINVGDTLDIAVDFTNKLLWYRINGGGWAGNGAGDPVAGTNGANFSGIGAGPYFPLFATQGAGVTVVVTANFGATAYTNPAPSGYGNC